MGAPTRSTASTRDEALARRHILYYSVVYPENYGFILRTLAYRGDPLNVLVPPQDPVLYLGILKVRPIDLLAMTDEVEEAVKEFVKHQLREMSHFFTG